MEIMSASPSSGLITLFIVNLLGVFIGSHYMKKVYLESFQKGLIVALILAVLNVTLGSVLDFMTAPFRWITLGLFGLVVDAIVIWVATKFVKGFQVESFTTAIGLAIVIALSNVLFDWVF